MTDPFGEEKLNFKSFGMQRITDKTRNLLFNFGKINL